MTDAVIVSAVGRLGGTAREPVFSRCKVLRFIRRVDAFPGGGVLGRGTVIGGRYELDPASRRSGGMGEVWFGYDNRLDRRIAVKFIKTARFPDGRPDKELARRFVRESRITARLEHPGVPTVYDCGPHGDDLYMVMQLVRGHPVSALLDETEIPVAWAAAIAAQVCSVLAVAHAGALVHRDLKPGNLMLCPDGTVKVLDFGIAAALASAGADAGGEIRLTRTGEVLGTPAYMAPEQAMTGAVSPRSDLYSLGVILDEMLAGDNQFTAPTALATMRNHTDVPPRPLRARRPDVPEGLERLVLWLLAKKPEDRPGGADVVYDRLLDFCRQLPPFPGYVDLDTPHPARMYATVVGRITAPLPAERPPHREQPSSAVRPPHTERPHTERMSHAERTSSIGQAPHAERQQHRERWPDGERMPRRERPPYGEHGPGHERHSGHERHPSHERPGHERSGYERHSGHERPGYERHSGHERPGHERHPGHEGAPGRERRPGHERQPEYGRGPAHPVRPPRFRFAAGLVQIEHEDIERARREAEALKAASRFGQAADALAEMVGPAVGSFGPTSSEVIGLRIELAELLFLSGDYRRAAPEFRRLAADVAAVEGPGSNLALRCRLMEANCHAAVGETDLALSDLRRLLDEERRFGTDEERLLELRCQIGLMELGAGRTTRAGRTLARLLPDLERRYGPHHANARKVRAILENLDGR
ncbi:protein kinase domain-containing protein [Streptosporangium sandarakinum]